MGRLLTGRPLTGRFLERRDGPYGKGRSLQGPLRADRLTGRPLTGSQESLREATGRDYQNLDLLPFKGPFSLTGALTGPPYGKAPYGEASYGRLGPCRKPLMRRDGPYGKGRGPVRVLHRERKALTKRDGPFTEKDAVFS